MIEVRIPQADFDLHRKHHVTLGNLLCVLLKEAGIPVVGLLALEHVERGELTQFRMADDDSLDDELLYCYRWRDDGDTENTPRTTYKGRRGEHVIKTGIHAEDDEL